MITEPEQNENDYEEVLTNTGSKNNENDQSDDSSENTVCEDCKNPEHSFISPCETLHILVWAKHEFEFYRPDKVMYATFEEPESNSLICVHFFGDHTSTYIPWNIRMIQSYQFMKRMICR